VPGRVDPDHSLPQIAKLNEDNGAILPRPAALPLIAAAAVTVAVSSAQVV
jgi:hypothetical protein